MEPEPSEKPDVTSDVPISNLVKKERKFPALDLKDESTLSTDNQPVLVIQSPKTPTLSRKLKAVSLDSEPQQQSNTLEVSRDVFSMPNTPKRQIKQKLSCDFDDGAPKCTLAPSFSSNLKKFASNNSISGSQTLKTLPEINALQDFSDCPPQEPPKVKAKGLLERRGSNASLTIDLGSTQSIAEVKPVPLGRLNTAKSVSNLYLSSMSSIDKCVCSSKKCEAKANSERRKSQETCGNCTIYESVPKLSSCKARCQNLKRCSCCSKSRRKSLSNENLYVPPCGFCEAESRESPDFKNGKGNNRKALFPRQPDLDSQLLSDDFKLHLQNIQYLQTAGNVLSLEELKQSCEGSRVPKLHQEFWEVPLNLQEKCFVSGSQSKNRYRGVLPNEHSRVLLPSSDGYIHANYIKGPDYTENAYIATQGPLSHTCTDFWEMVWHSQCKSIVMLTGLVEKGRHKCELYFPLGKPSDTKEKTFLYVKTAKTRDKFTFDSQNYNEYEMVTFEFEEKNEVTFGKYHIRFVKRHDLDECQIRQLELKKTDLNVEPRTIYHYWLSNWPDHKMANPDQVLKMAIDVLSVVDGNRRGSQGQESVGNVASARTSESSDFRVGPSSSSVSHSDQTSSRFSFESKCSDLELSIDREENDSCVETIEVKNSSIETSSTRTFSVNVSQNVALENFQKFDYETSSKMSANRDSNFTNFSFSDSLEKQSSTENFQTPSFEFTDLDSSKSNSKVTKFDFNDVNLEIRKKDETESSSVSEQFVSCHSCHSTKEMSGIDVSNHIKSREGSISDFNKETLSNRCSLDSKLGNLNKISDFKSEFKRDLYPLKAKTVAQERRKSAEHIRLPIIVHCSAGIGRTGCFLAILNGIQQLRVNRNVDILAILCSLRLNRGGMVQTAEQYELIHRVLSLYSENI